MRDEGTGARGPKGHRPDKSVPGKEGRFELGEREVSDPLDPGKSMRGLVNVRESTIAHMLAHNQISQLEALALERYSWLRERAAIGPSRSIDLAAGRGSGSPPDPISERLMRAVEQLEMATRGLGERVERLLNLLVEGNTVGQIASAMAVDIGLSGRRAEGYVSGRIIEAARDLVRLWKMQGAPKTKAGSYPGVGPDRGRKISVRDAILASGPLSLTGPSHEIKVGRFGDTEREEKRPKTWSGGQVAGSAAAAPRRRK